MSQIMLFLEPGLEFYFSLEVIISFLSLSHPSLRHYQFMATIMSRSVVVLQFRTFPKTSEN